MLQYENTGVRHDENNTGLDCLLDVDGAQRLRRVSGAEAAAFRRTHLNVS